MSAAVFTAAKLVDGDTELVFIPDSGLGAVNVQLGLPSARVVTESRTDVDGVRDTTSRFGARAVSIGFRSMANTTTKAAELQDRLHWFCSAARRPYLVFTMDGQAERRILLRHDSGSSSFTGERNMLVDSVQQWVAPDGIIEASVETEDTITATVDNEAGRSYDLSFDRSYPASNPIGVATVTNDGNVDAWPVIRLYGPCDDPRVENQTTGYAFEITGLSVAAGDYLEVDMRNRTVRLNSLANQSRLQFLDFTTSSWWPLAPGNNSCRYYPVSFSAGSEAALAFRSAWL